MIDIIRKYKTRSGRNVVILITDSPGAEPVVGYIIWPGEDTVTAESWNAVGKYGSRMSHETLTSRLLASLLDLEVEK